MLVGLSSGAYLPSPGRERLAIVCCDVGGDAAIAGRAALWAAGFHSGVNVALEGGTASLASEDHSEGELRAIWRSALLNETLLVRGASRRAAVFAALVK